MCKAAIAPQPSVFKIAVREEAATIAGKITYISRRYAAAGQYMISQEQKYDPIFLFFQFISEREPHAEQDHQPRLCVLLTYLRAALPELDPWSTRKNFILH
jgi:hypothetical protein